MNEFLNTVFSPSNAVSTGLFCLVLIYWLSVILGALDLDFLDFDIDIDADVDVDVDADVDADAGGIAWLNNILTFFNLGKIPFMVWLSFLALPLWFIHINLNHLFGIRSLLGGLLFFLPALIGGLLVTKFATWPFVKLFERIDRDSKEKVILGRVGTVVIPADENSRGQAEVETGGSYLRLYIKTRKGVTVSRGDRVLFIQELQGKDEYLIEPYFD